MGEPTPQTVVARDRWGSAGGRALQGNPTWIPQDPATGAPVVVCQALQDLKPDRVDRARCHRSEAGAALVGTGKRLDAKPGRGVLASLTGLELALGLQTRWRWRDEEAQGASGSVWHRGTGMGAGLTRVRERREALVHERLESIAA